MNSEQGVLNLLQKLVRDSVVLTSAGSSFHHCSAETEESCDFDRILFALSDGGKRHPAEYTAKL